MANRDCVPVTETVTLRAIFNSACGKPKNTDAAPTVFIYKPGTLPADLATEIADGNPNAFDTIPGVNVVNLAPGFYEAEYTVPQAGPEGEWIDLWVGDVDGVTVWSNFSFSVIEKGTVETQSILPNSLIAILLDGEIADINGNRLGQELQFTFSTTYEPYYASPDLLRLETGGWLDGIPNDTLSLVVHWASLEADMWSRGTAYDGPNFQLARTKFVVFDAILRCLLLPADLGGKQKKLGDLMIARTGDQFAEIIESFQDKREEWLRVLNSGGTISPGQSFAPAIGIKGAKRTDGKEIGRLWVDPQVAMYGQPTQNNKISRTASGRYKFGWTGR